MKEKIVKSLSNTLRYLISIPASSTPWEAFQVHMDFMGSFTFSLPIFSEELPLGNLVFIRQLVGLKCPERANGYGKVLHVSITYEKEKGSSGPTPALLYTGSVMDLQPHGKFSSYFIRAAMLMRWLDTAAMGLKLLPWKKQSE